MRALTIREIDYVSGGYSINPDDQDFDWASYDSQSHPYSAAPSAHIIGGITSFIQSVNNTISEQNRADSYNAAQAAANLADAKAALSEAIYIGVGIDSWSGGIYEASFWSGPHEYLVDNLICTYSSSSMCTASNVFQLSLVYNAPRAFAFDYHETFTGDTVITPFGAVDESVDNFNMSVTNSTVDGWHLLNPGTVTRTVVARADGIHIVTHGVGDGILPVINERTAAVLWGSVDINIKALIALAGIAERAYNRANGATGLQ